jgi:hypothetical protein
MMDIHSFEAIARQRQQELRRDALLSRRLAMRSAASPRLSRRWRLVPAFLVGVGRALVAVGHRLECLGADASHACIEQTPVRTP